MADSGQSNSVNGELRIWTPYGSRPLEPLSAAVRVAGIADVVRLSLELESKTTWELQMDAAAAAYVAGHMAIEAGVRFG